jgi:hypothetical protein
MKRQTVMALDIPGSGQIFVHVSKRVGDPVARHALRPITRPCRQFQADAMKTGSDLAIVAMAGIAGILDAGQRFGAFAAGAGKG